MQLKYKYIYIKYIPQELSGFIDVTTLTAENTFTAKSDR